MTDERTRTTGGTPGTVDRGAYVAWLAVRVEDEADRRRCRLVAEAYLDWSWSDGGPVGTRRSRFVAFAGCRPELTRARIEDALDRLAEYRAVVARTLPNGR